jgi:hypothetical protein
LGLGRISSIRVDYVPSSTWNQYFLIIDFANYQYRVEILGTIFDSDQFVWGTENIVITGSPDNCGDKYTCGA